jgi:hypothetical protein
VGTKIYYIFLCACPLACLCGVVAGHVGVCMSARSCSLAYPAYIAHAPYSFMCGLSDSATHLDIISKTARFLE